jgi:hypothetical protein
VVRALHDDKRAAPVDDGHLMQEDVRPAGRQQARDERGPRFGVLHGVARHDEVVLAVKVALVVDEDHVGSERAPDAGRLRYFLAVVLERDVR